MHHLSESGSTSHTKPKYVHVAAISNKQTVVAIDAHALSGTELQLRRVVAAGAEPRDERAIILVYGDALFYSVERKHIAVVIGCDCIDRGDWKLTQELPFDVVHLQPNASNQHRYEGTTCTTA